MKYAFCRLIANRSLGVLAGILCVAAWDASGAVAQQTESLPLPQIAEQTLDASASASEGYEVLLRGPVHEAFAEPVGVAADAALSAPEPPPEPVQELPPEARPTGENVVWIPGYWSWDDQESEYIYVSGLWRDVPPGQRWTPGYWHEVENGYQWQPGFWISETREEISYLPAPPETLEIGPNIAAPSENHFWIPGCWQYAQSDYTWRPGFWSPIHSGWIWVPAHYVPTAYGYVYVDGYWDYEPGNRGLLYASVVFHRPVYTNPGYYYQPRYALGNTAALLVNLFIRPNYGMYYYGNHYSPYYYSRGFQPWYSPLRGGSYVSPFVSYYRWKYARQGVDFYDRMDLWKRRYEHDGHDHRPRTYDQLRRSSIASGIASPSGNNDLQLISSMDSLIRQRESRYTRVDQSHRQRYENLAREIRSISDLRRKQDFDLERRGDGPGNRRDIAERDSDDRRDRVQADFRFPQSYRMGRPSLDGERTRDREPDRGRDRNEARVRDGGRAPEDAPEDARSRGAGMIDRNIDGRPGSGIAAPGIDGRRSDSDSRRPGSRTPDLDTRRPGDGIGTPDIDTRRPGSGLRAPELDTRRPRGGIGVPDLDTRRPGSGIGTPELDTRRPRGGIGVPDLDTRRPGNGIGTPDMDTRRPRGGIGIPNLDTRRPGSSMRIPSGDPRGPGSGLRAPGSESLGPSGSLRIPRGDSRGPGSGIRVPSGDLRGPGSILRSPGSSGPSGQGLNLTPPSIDRGPSGRPDRGRSGGIQNRIQRAPDLGGSRSISPGSAIGNSRRSSSDSGRAESRGRGNRGGEGNRGRNRDR